MWHTFFQGTSVSITFYLFENYQLWMMDSKPGLLCKDTKNCVCNTEVSNCYNFKQMWVPKWDYNYNLIIIIKLRLALFVTYTKYNQQWNVFSAFNPSKCTHTLGAVGSRHCSIRGAVGGLVPCSRVSPQTWTIPAGAEIWTHNLGL